MRTLQNMNKQNISEFAKKAIDALAYIIRKIRIECGITIGQASTEILLEKSRLWNYENTKHSMRVETFAFIIDFDNYFGLYINLLTSEKLEFSFSKIV